MKTKENKNRRDVAYYMQVVSELIQKGNIIMQDDFRKILEGIDKKLGINTFTQKTIEDRFIDIFEPVLNVETVMRSKEERALGKNRKVRLIELKETNLQNLEKIARERMSKKKKAVAQTILPVDKVRRDAYVRKAREIREQNPALTHEGAIEEAKKNVRVIRKDLVIKTFKILQRLKYSADQQISAGELRKIFGCASFGKGYVKSWVKQWENYDIRIFNTLVEDPVDRRTWRLKLDADPSKLMEKVREFARTTYNLTLVDDKVSREPAAEKKLVRVGNSEIKSGEKTTLTPRTKYLIFVMAGMLMKNNGKSLTALEVGAVLRGNRYHRIDVSSDEVGSIVKSFPEYFSQGFQNRLSFNFARKGSEVWKEIQNKFSPKNEKWPIPWVINSGLGLEEVKMYFPESYQVREDVKVGSKIIIVMADRSIDSFIRLSKLQLKMRQCDFPIEDEDFVKNLAGEITVGDNLLRGFMLDRSKQDWEDKITNNGRILYQIEENYI